MESGQWEHRGHRIELRPQGAERRARAARPERAEELELIIDGRPVPYGRLPDGSYALKEYAFDWRDDLVDLARALIDYREKSKQIQGQASREEG